MGVGRRARTQTSGKGGKSLWDGKSQRVIRPAGDPDKDRYVDNSGNCPHNRKYLGDEDIRGTMYALYYCGLCGITFYYPVK